MIDNDYMICMGTGDVPSPDTVVSNNVSSNEKRKEVSNGKEIIHSQRLKLVDYEKEASDIFCKFINEHPEYRKNNTAKYYIKKEEKEEDYYGHFGGVDRWVIIYINK